MADEKKYLRAILKDTRESLTPSFAAASSARIQSLLLLADLYLNSRAVVLYSALSNEISTDAIFSDALATGREVFFPRLDRASRTLGLSRVEGRSDLGPGAHGILEPVSPSIDTGSIPPCLVVVPGLAFTRRCERIGRGGGHYDRLLAQLAPHTITAGLAYSFQLLDDIPQSEWDRRLNFVVTESAIYPAPEAIWRESGIRTQGGNPR